MVIMILISNTMEKIKKILTTPALAKVWKHCNYDATIEFPSMSVIRRLLKQKNLSKELIDEYAYTYYILYLANYLMNTTEGKDFVWTNKDKLSIKESKQGKIDMHKELIVNEMDELLLIGGIEIKEILQIKEILGVSLYDED